MRSWSMTTPSKENDSFSPINYLLPVASQCQVTGDKHPTYAGIWADLIFCRSCADNHSSDNHVSSWPWKPCSAQRLHVEAFLPHPVLHLPFPSLPRCSLSISSGTVNVNVSLRAENSVFYSQPSDVSASLHCHLPTAKKKLLQPKLRADQVYDYKHKHLAGDSIAWTFSKIATAGSILGPRTSSVLYFLPGLQDRAKYPLLESRP